MRRKILFALALMLAFTIFFTAISASAATQEYYDALYAVIIEAEACDPSKYTPESYQQLQVALDRAYNILERESVSSSVLQRTMLELSDAIKKLEPIVPDVPLDVSNLISTINTAIELKRDDYDLTDAEWESFQNQISLAENVLNDYALTQELADITAANLANLISQIEQRRIDLEDSDDTQSPDIMDDTEGTTIITDIVKPTVQATEKVTKVYPKSTTPFAQGGFIEIGCNASAAISALVIVGIIGSALVIKKKED